MPIPRSVRKILAGGRPSGTIGRYTSAFCIAHAAAVARDARILSALVTRDASGTILSRFSRSSFGTSSGSCFFFLLSFSFYFFLFLTKIDIMCDRMWLSNSPNVLFANRKRVPNFRMKFSRRARRFAGLPRENFAKNEWCDWISQWKYKQLQYDDCGIGIPREKFVKDFQVTQVLSNCVVVLNGRRSPCTACNKTK